MKIVKKNQLKIVIFTAVKNLCILHGRVFILFSHFPVQPHKIARNSKIQRVFLGRDNKGPDQSVQMLLSGSLFSPMKKVFFFLFFLMMLLKALKT